MRLGVRFATPNVQLVFEQFRAAFASPIICEPVPTLITGCEGGIVSYDGDFRDEVRLGTALKRLEEEVERLTGCRGELLLKKRQEDPWLPLAAFLILLFNEDELARVDLAQHKAIHS